MSPTVRASIKLVLLTYSFTWLPWVYLAVFVTEDPTSNPLYIVGGLGPVLGFLVAALHDRLTGNSFRNPFTRVRSLTSLLVILPFVSAVPVLASGLLGRMLFGVDLDIAGWNDSVAQYGGLLLFIVLIFIGGPFTEEWSWHGYLWPRLRSTNSMLRASIIAGSVWAVWHWPLFLIDATAQADGLHKFGYAFFFVFSCLVQMYLWGQFYELTGFGVLAAILAHFTLNLSSFVITYDYRVRAIEMALNLVVILVLHGLIRRRARLGAQPAVPLAVRAA